MLTLTKNLDFQYSRVTHSTIFCKIARLEVKYQYFHQKCSRKRSNMPRKCP